MTKSSASIKWLKFAQVLFVLNAVVWLVFGAVSLFRLGGGNPEQVVETL